MTNDDLVRACKNIGFDLTCGACAEQFYTGSRMHDHDESCTTSSEARNYAEVIDNVREALGQESTHYLVIADDVKDLVETACMTEWAERIGLSRNSLAKRVRVWGVQRALTTPAKKAAM